MVEEIVVEPRNRHVSPKFRGVSVTVMVSDDPVVKDGRSGQPFEDPTESALPSGITVVND